MRLALKSFGAAALLAVTLSGCETKITEISAVCRPGDQPTETVRWVYTAKVDPSVIKRIPRAIDLTLHYSGTEPRAVPQIITYFYRKDGAALRVVSSAKATLSPKGTFTYHVDTGGYEQALTRTGRGNAEEVGFIVDVDGNYFGGLLSPPTCGRYADGHIDLGKPTEVPDLKDKHPINLGASAWLDVTPLPPVALRMEGSEVSTYAFFPAPIALTASKNATAVPDDLAKQAAEIGLIQATPTFAITGEPTPYLGSAPGAASTPSSAPTPPGTAKPGVKP